MEDLVEPADLQEEVLEVLEVVQEEWDEVLEEQAWYLGLVE